jgi:Protein of unknown function (DUF2938)
LAACRQGQSDTWKEATMTQTIEVAVRILGIGVGATIVMDMWLLLLKRLGIPPLNLAFLGRWIGHLRHGQWTHTSIATAAPIEGELWIGWTAHYAIGIAFAALLVSMYGLGWARSPTLFPALSTGIVTVVAPLFVLQPALGAGIASSRTPTPVRNCLKSLVTHTVYGIGLYLAARASALLVPLAR